MTSLTREQLQTLRDDLRLIEALSFIAIGDTPPKTVLEHVKKARKRGFVMEDKNKLTPAGVRILEEAHSWLPPVP